MARIMYEPECPDRSEEKTEPFSQSEVDSRLYNHRVEELGAHINSTVPLDNLVVPPDKGIRILVRPLTRSRSVSPGSHESAKWLALRAEVEVAEQPDLPQHKVLAVTQTPNDINFSVRIPGENNLQDGSPRPPLWCELYYDPASDNQILLNRSDVPITLARVSQPDASPGMEYTVNPHNPKNLFPGTWRIRVSGIEVLDFRIIEKRPAKLRLPPSSSSSDSSLSEMVSSNGKRSFMAEEDHVLGPEKKLRALGPPAAKDEDGVIEFLPPKANPLVFPLPNAGKGKEVVLSNGHPLLELQRDETVEVPGYCDVEEYRITKRDPIASTTLSSVFTAEHSDVPDGTITVKVLKTRTATPATGAAPRPQETERNVIRQADIWLREFQSQRDLQHDSIVRLYGGDARYLSFYMEHVDARDLSTRNVWRNPADDMFAGDRVDARRILQDIAGALQYLHARGMVHNDIKPANILYSRERGALLCDFGLSTLMHNPASTGGTPYYIPPEFIGRKVRGRPSDVWALGVTMLYVLRKISFPDARGHRDHPRQLYWMIADLNRPPARQHQQQPGSSAAPTAISQMQRWLAEINNARERLNRADKLEKLIAEMLVPNPNHRIDMGSVIEVVDQWGAARTPGG